MSSQPSSPPLPRVSAGYYVLAAGLVFLGVCALNIVNMFRLGSEANALRSTVMASVPGLWDKTVALRVGSITTGLVRCGSRFFHMPMEPRAALDSVHGAEVGVYKLRDEPNRVAYGPILAQADKAMTARGWTRVVGVIEERQLVAIYLPRKGVSARHMRCCLAVLNGRDLVVVSARGNLDPLLAIAAKHLPHGPDGHLLAWH